MGMFDYVRCDATLPDDRATGEECQSKCMDCRMDLYIITSDGRLTKREYDGDGCPSSGAATRVDYTGMMHFYAGPHTYKATFFRGRLEELAKEGGAE